MSKQAIYLYDTLGRLQEVQFSTGGKITYSYDQLGSRSSVVEVAASCCFNWKGAWSNATAYVIGDAVSFGGSSYIAVANNTNSQPPSANWNTLAAKGDTGPQGPAGSGGSSGSVRSSLLTRSSTTALADDGDLQVNVEANSAYAFTAIIQSLSQSGNPGFKWQFVGPSGSTINFIAYDSTGANYGPTAGGVSNNMAIATTGRWLTVTGKITVGATAGQLKLQWAQNTSNANYTAVQAGSSLTLAKI